MKKFVTIVLMFFMLFSLGSCSNPRAKADAIYNDEYLSVFEKIDQLYAIYSEELSKENAHNQNMSDAAWDQIVEGNYDTAVGLLDNQKSGAGLYAIAYIAKLAQPLPKPTNLYFEVDEHKFTKAHYFGFDLKYEYNKIYLCPSDKKTDYYTGQYSKGHIYVNGRRVNSWDDGQSKYSKGGFRIDVMKPEYSNYYPIGTVIDVKVEFELYPGIKTGYGYYKNTTFIYEGEYVVGSPYLNVNLVS